MTTEEIGDLAQRAGLREIAVLAPQDTGFYPPIVGTVGYIVGLGARSLLSDAASTVVKSTIYELLAG